MTFWKRKEKKKNYTSKKYSKCSIKYSIISILVLFTFLYSFKLFEERIIDQ